MLHRIGLGGKIISGYLLIVVLVLITGAVGYKGIRTVAHSLHVVANEEVPVVDMANEMKKSLMSARNSMEEYRGATATIATYDPAKIEEIQKEYRQALSDFDTFTKAIREGAVLKGGKVVIKTDNAELGGLVQQADRIHNEKFQVSAANMMNEGKDLIKRNIERNDAMKRMEDVYDKVIRNANAVEKMLGAEIRKRTAEGATHEQTRAVLRDQVPLADSANEIKTALAETRIALEEIVKANRPEEIDNAEKRYEKKVEAFDRNVKTILQGGEIDGASIPGTDNDKVRAAVKEMDLSHEEFQKAGKNLIALSRALISDSQRASADMAQMDGYGEEADRLLDKVEVAADKEMAAARRAGEIAVDVSVKWIVVTLICALVLGTLIGVLLSRSIAGPIKRIIKGLNEGADQVASASAQVSSASQSLAEGASEQAASIEETSSSIEEMSSMTRKNADNAGQADAITKEAGALVMQANDSMARLTASMDEISAAGNETSKIIKTIDEIAFQTNLLALNAAVEAARAGEAGAGFAVVADEVRNLAMRAAEAAKNTASLIEGTVAKVSEGSGLVKETDGSFTEAASMTAKTGELVAEIAAASGEQAQGIDLVNKAIAEMDKVTQQNAANAEESASASEELNAQAEQMKSIVADLAALVSGKRKRGGDGGGTAHAIPGEKGSGSPARLAPPTSPKGAGDVNPQRMIPFEKDSFQEF
jgi:methyl-accepting chemotaxis protein